MTPPQILNPDSKRASSQIVELTIRLLVPALLALARTFVEPRSDARLVIDGLAAVWQTGWLRVLWQQIKPEPKRLRRGKLKAA